MGQAKVLVTGMSGLIGRALRVRLEGNYRLAALNRSAVDGVECHRVDIADLAAIRPAFDGVDVVVHLAAAARGTMPWDEVLPYNVIGAYNVFEAARQAGVKRVVFASSGATVTGYERESPLAALVAGRYDEVGAFPVLTHETPTRPTTLYGCSKVWGETLARYYADVHRLSAICVRIGHVSAEDRPLDAREYSVWCSQRDAARLLELCVAAPPTLRFDVFFAVSRNRWSYRDLEHARAVLGFEPLDAAEAHRPPP
jgi:nucleoside-diphosphate-sugar epimerase